MTSRNPSLSNSLLAASLALAAGQAFAADPALPAMGEGSGPSLQLEGFVSLVAGKAMSGRAGDYVIPDSFDEQTLPCPCYIARWETFGVYHDDWSLNPESRYGFQARLGLNDRLSATLQIVGYATDDLKPEVSWAYVEYRPDDAWSLQAGRKRLPLFYYSDFQDVGYAYPWLRPPTDVYNWHMTHYNGVSVMHRGHLGEWSTKASLWYGEEEDDNNKLIPIYYGLKTGIDEAWRNILGGYLEVSRDWFNARLVYMQTDLHRYVRPAYDAPYQRFDGEPMEFYGLSLNADKANWLVRSEFNLFRRPEADVDYEQVMVGVGYQWGAFTPMLTWSRFLEKPQEFGEAHSTLSLSLRYDFAENMALKLQYDRFDDHLFSDSWDFVGDSEVFAVGLDMVF